MPDSKRIGAVATLLLFVATLAPSVQAQSQSAAAVPATNSADTTLSGVVQDSRGLPLLGAFVAVIALGADEPTAIVVTDGRGRFNVTGVPTGVYSLLVGSLGFTGTVLQGVSVPATVPVTLQLEPEEQRELSAFDAPLDLGFAVRSSNRDVLRREDATIVTDDGTAVAAMPGAVTGTDSVVRPAFNLGGEVSIWGFTEVSDRQTVGVTTLNLNGSNDWNLRAHVGHDGTVWSAGNFHQEFGGNHDLQIGFGYVGGGFEFMLPDETRSAPGWIGRLQVQDAWRASEAFELRYGARYEHHNYMANGELVSPEMELAYRVVEGTRVTTGVTMNAVGLGLAEDNGFEVMSVLNQAGMQFNDLSQVTPERSLRYHLGVEQLIGDAASVRVRAYYDDVTNELLGVYFKGRDVHNYLLFNVGDSAARGLEVGVAGRIMDTVTGELTYAFRDRDDTMPLPYANGFVPAAADVDPMMRQSHEVNATVAAQVPNVRTTVQASYNWRYGLPVVRDGQTRADFGRFNLLVRQPLPFRALRTEWSAMFQVRNLLGPDYDGLYDVTLAELVGLTRGIAGGLAVRF